MFVAAAFALVIGLTSLKMFRLVRRLPLDTPEGERLRHLGGGMLAALVAYGLTIATTSYFNIIPMLGWVMIALCVAYIRTTKSWLEAYERGGEAGDTEPARLSDADGDPQIATEPEAVSEPSLAAASAPVPTDNSFGLQTPWEHLPVIDEPKR